MSTSHAEHEHGSANGDHHPHVLPLSLYLATWGTLLFLNTILPVCGYLLPWCLLAYYLIKSRELANP